MRKLPRPENSVMLDSPAEMRLAPFVDSLDLEFGGFSGPGSLTITNELAGCQVP